MMRWTWRDYRLFITCNQSCYHPNSDLCETSHIPIMPRYENMIWRTRRNHTVHSTKPTVWYKLKTCIVQTINSAYKGISVFYTDKVSVYTVDMKHRQLNQWDSDTAWACDYWYWSGTGQLGHMHNSPLWHQKGRHSKESVYKTKQKVSACLWQTHDLDSSCSSDKVKWGLRSCSSEQKWSLLHASPSISRDIASKVCWTQRPGHPLTVGQDAGRLSARSSLTEPGISNSSQKKPC